MAPRKIGRVEGIESGTPSVGWEEAFETFYALTDPKLNQLIADIGTLRKPSGQALNVTFYTRDVLKQKLAQEVNKDLRDLLDKGMLGGVDKEGTVHFREDIANLLGNNRQFIVTKAAPAKVEGPSTTAAKAVAEPTEPPKIVNAKVASISHANYAITNLALGALSMPKAKEEAPADKEAKLSQEPQGSTLDQTPKQTESPRPKAVERKSAQGTAMPEKAIGSKARIAAQQRRLERQREARKDERIKDRREVREEAIEEETAKREIKAEETKAEKVRDQTQKPEQSPGKFRPLGSS